MMRKMTQPEDMPHRFAEAWNLRRADLLAGLFLEDADFVNVVGIWWDKRSEIEEAHAYGLRVIFNRSTLRVGKVKVKSLGEDYAVVHARMRLSGQTKGEQTAGLRFTLFLFVLKKDRDHWYCVSAQNTDIVACAETNIRTETGVLEPADYRRSRSK